MKKLLLTAAAAAIVVAASAAPTALTKVWTKSVENAFPADKAVYSANVAVDATGNLIATGAYTEDFTLGTANLEATGTSAYVAKYTAAGDLAWAVSFNGAATVSAVDTDADGNIYVAGSFADEVIFGTTAGSAVTKKGMEVDGAPTEKQNAAFIAKYSPEGALATVETFIPAMHDETAANRTSETMPYWYGDGDIYFEIKEIKVAADKLYISAAYTGTTTAAGLTFSAPYVNYFGFMYSDVAVASLFALDTATLAKGAEIAKVAYSGDNNDEVYDTSTCWSARFDVKDSKIIAAFAVTGTVNLTVGQASELVNAEGQAFVYALIENGTLAKNKSVALTSATTVADNSFALVSFAGDKAVAAGRLFTSETVNEVDVEHQNIFAASIDLATLEATVKPCELIDGDISYSVVSSAAALASGEIRINTLGYYNTTKKDGETTLYAKGDFSGKVKSLIFADDAFTAAADVTDAYAVAAAGEYVAFGQIASTGADFSLYKAPQAGITDITFGDADAPAEYYNLQGVKVANPENGIYIVRRAGKVTKELVK